MENERLIGLLAYLSALTKLANSEVSYLCTKEIGECVGWIRLEFERVGGVDAKSLALFSVEQLAQELLSRDGVYGGNVEGPCKWELDTGAKATHIAIERSE